jgi:peptidoglycan/xylan/chitin deacetylase (PgdA/CDA1 family)
MFHNISSGQVGEFIHPSVDWPASLFERQLELLSRWRRVISMSALASMLEAGKSPPRGSIVLTFDDGYLNLLHLVAPMLAAAEMPATVYLPTAYIDSGRPQWIDELHFLFTTRRLNRLRIDQLSLEVHSKKAAEAAFRLVSQRLAAASYLERGRILLQVRESFGTDANMPRTTLVWSDVRQLCKRFPLIELGGHTLGHLDLRPADGELTVNEVLGCAERIQQETGRRPEHFSFPYGRSNPMAQEIVKNSGFRTAVLDGSGALVTKDSNPWALSRVDGHAGVARLKYLTSGAFTAVP